MVLRLVVAALAALGAHAAQGFPSWARRFLEMAGPSATQRIRSEIIEAVRPTREERGVPVQFRALVAFGTKGR